MKRLVAIPMPESFLRIMNDFSNWWNANHDSIDVKEFTKYP